MAHDNIRRVKLGGHPAIVQRPRNAFALYSLAHGAGAGMTHAFMVEIADALAARKVATVRWDFPYMAAGKARTDPAPVAEAAVRAVWDALDPTALPFGSASRCASAALGGDLPRFAGGKSYGGRMTARAHAAQPLPGALGLIFLGFPLHPPDKPGPKMERAGFTPASEMDRAEHLARTTTPLLLLQGTRDKFALPEHLHPVIATLPHATLHEVAHADHGFDVLVRSGRTHAEVIAELADVIASWMEVRIAACGRATRRGTRRS